MNTYGLDLENLPRHIAIIMTETEDGQKKEAYPEVRDT